MLTPRRKIQGPNQGLNRIPPFCEAAVLTTKLQIFSEVRVWAILGEITKKKARSQILPSLS